MLHAIYTIVFKVVAQNLVKHIYSMYVLHSYTYLRALSFLDLLSLFLALVSQLIT